MMEMSMLLGWIIPIGLIVAVVLYLEDKRESTGRPERAIDILEKFYARGDISREEFLIKRADLLGKKESPPR